MTVSDTASGSPGRASGRRSGLIGLAAELLKFGAVGAIAFVVDFSVYNLLRFTVLDDKPIGAKIVSVAVATVVSWLGSRYWTFRHGRNAAVGKEFLQFAVINVGGLLVAMLCLYVSHYMLGFSSKLADNISGNGVGLVLGTAFRYLMYKLMLFHPEAPTTAAGEGSPSGPDVPLDEIDVA